MFTGIVEEKGTIASMKEVSDEAIELTIEARTVLENLKSGDSVAVNGICLTVTSLGKEEFAADVMPETIRATSLSRLEEGGSVNLERALLPTDRLGGHFVTGHVDGIGKIVRKEAYENAIYFDIEIPDAIMPYFIEKGSVAVDGVSLTVFATSMENSVITVSIIPHTAAVTILGERNVGDIVNIECDMLAKHVHHYLENMKGVR